MNNTELQTTNTEEYAALIGIDWASEKNDVWVYDTATGDESYRTIKQTPEDLAEWAADLRTRFGGRRVAVALEQARGGLIYALLGYEFITLYPINPSSLAKYRGTFSPSRAKDDPTDAELLMDLLRKHRDQFKAWRPDDEHTRTLAMLNEERRKNVQMRLKIVQRLQATLKNYFPQALELVCGNLISELACAFLLKWPTLDDLKRAKPETVRAFYYRHMYRVAKLIEDNVVKIAAAVPLTTDTAVMTASSLAAQTLARQIRAINVSIEEYDQAIKRLFKSHPDAYIFASFPGAGANLAPRLLTAFGTDRTRFPTAIDVQTYAGIAPVVERSGKQMWVHWRWACPKFIRQSFHEFARCSLGYSLWARAYFQQQKERGASQHAAFRALAYKWIRILYRCWQDRLPYDEDRYIEALKRSGSPLCKRIEALKNA
jgi:transposase